MDDIFSGLNPNIDLELDFDLSDFTIFDGEVGGLIGYPQEHILKPSLSVKSISNIVAYENAQAFSEQLDLTDGARTFAYVSGSFIFGDLIEALWEHRGVGIKKLYICSLSMSANNIDSLRNILDYSGIEHLTLVLSAYFYSHEKGGLVPYMYERLDDPRVQIAFGAYHVKLFTIETAKGNVYTCHGSANLRSSNSVEQIMFEAGNRELHEFNAAMLDEIADLHGTINHRRDGLNNAQSWTPFRLFSENRR